MPIYKTNDNSLHELSEQDITNGGLSLLPNDCVEICEEEANELRATQPLTNEQKTLNIVYSVQSHLDAEAKNHGYDNILSACSYATSSIPQFSSEAAACILWRDKVWSKCYTELSKVNQGLRDMPTPEEAIAELPEMIWPK